MTGHRRARLGEAVGSSTEAEIAAADDRLRSQGERGAQDAADEDARVIVESASSTGDVDVEPTSWAAVDLTAALTGLDVPPAEIGRRVDGAPLLYRGRTHWFIGDSESCKTWAALLVAVQVLDGGGRVLWIDFEDDDRGVVARLRSLGADSAVIHARFVYVRPEEPLVTRNGAATAGNAALGELLDRAPYDLAVIDGVTEAMVTEGLDLRDNADVAVWARRLPKRIARHGAAVVCIDHLPKARDGNTRDAIGGQHKRAGTTGAAFRFDVVRPFARPGGPEPSKGQVTLVVTKDRPGYVRARALGDRVAVLTLTGYPDGSVNVALAPPDVSVELPEMDVIGKVRAYLLMYDGASWRQLVEAIDVRHERVRAAVSWMARQGWLTVTRVGVAHRHALTEDGRVGGFEQ
jgi:hypothetical protein